MAIDSHMHINSKVTLLDTQGNMINRINSDPNLECVVNIGLDIDTSKECISISKSNFKFYSSIGIHPLYIESNNPEELYNLVTDKVVAIGEIGLDDGKNNFNEQRKYLIKQISIANELHLPVIIHSNNTNKLVIDIFEKYVKPKYGCVFHCFQPDLDDLSYIVSNGYYISFAGRITYKTAKKSIEVAKAVPNELFLVETDSPYIAPEPFRDKINESANIKYIIRRLAEVKDMSYEEIENISSDNAKRLFKIRTSH